MEEKELENAKKKMQTTLEQINGGLVLSPKSELNDKEIAYLSGDEAKNREELNVN